ICSAHHEYDLIGLDANNFAVRAMQADPALHTSFGGAPGSAEVASQHFLVREHRGADNKRNNRSGYCFPHDIFFWHASTHAESPRGAEEIRRIASLFPI